MQASEVVAVITAAGRSSRMGRPKGLLDWEGLPLITHQVNALKACREVIVVLGHEPLTLLPFIPGERNVSIVENTHYDEGRASSLVAGFRTVRGTPAGILVVAIDQPLPRGVVASLLNAHAPQSPIAVPVYRDRRGHPILFRGDLLPELLAIEEDTEGLRAVTEKYRAQRQEVAVEVPGIWLDLNSPDEYETHHKVLPF